MRLETYISDLLYRYDCVVVPNFGAFLCNCVSAKLHESTHTFYPPKKVLSFNEQIQNNDGLLANYIAEVEKIPYSTATEKIVNYIASVKSHLSNGEKIRFENIGEFILNTENKTIFSPSFHINYLTDAFGLSHFTLTNIKRETTIIETAIPSVLVKEKQSSKNWLKYAATVAILIGLSGFGVVYYGNAKVETHNQQAQQKANALLNTKVQEATFVIDNPLPAVMLSFKSEKRSNYHAVAGAFSVETNANTKVRQLKAQGFNYARKIGKNKSNLHIVIYGSFSTRNEALRELRLIQRENNSDAWLLIKRF